MKRNNLLICMMLLFSFYTTRAELLIVQKGDDGRFIPLPAKDTDESVWGPIKQYQWPQCIINSDTMSEQEKIELLSPGHAYAEERFIQNKFAQDGKQYEVVFVPTVLYELFSILCIFKNENENNPMQQEVERIINAPVFNIYKIDLTNLIAIEDSFWKNISRIYKVYEKVNNAFFVHGVWGYINNQCVQFLFSLYPELHVTEDALVISEIIQKKSKEIAVELVNQLRQLNVYDSGYLGRHSREYMRFANKQGPAILFNNIKNESASLLDIIGKTIDLEYEARALNKALLLRGTSFEQIQVGPQLTAGVHPPYRRLAGSTIPKKEMVHGTSPVEALYKKKELELYSISFGNSLFAGSLRDREASAYYFLMGRRFSGASASSAMHSIGYALFIDKKEYVEHRVHNLFFISPLMTLAGLMESGEYFHSRTTAAVPKKSSRRVLIRGLKGVLVDPSGILLITRDPLRHAELFSNYLAQHGRILQEGSFDQLTEEEQKFAQEVLKSQQEAAQFYKRTRRFKKVVDKRAKRIRGRKQRMPVAQSAEQQVPEALAGAAVGVEEVKVKEGE